MTRPVEEFIDEIPDRKHIRDELARNARERDLLRKLLKLAEQKASVAAVRTASGCEVQS